MYKSHDWCRCFDPGGSLDRRVNCRRVPQPRWVGARRSTKGGTTEGDMQEGKPATFVLSCAQVGCACSRGLQASTEERERWKSRRLRIRPAPRLGALAVGGYKRPPGGRSEWPYASACLVLVPERPTLSKRALALPFIGVRRGSRCTMGGVAECYVSSGGELVP